MTEKTASSQTEATKSPPTVIKKYANRRLYNTATSSYVTLEHLRQMVKEGSDFIVYDARTGEDITRSVLAQIILEEEGKGHNLLPISLLRQLICLYGDNVQNLLPGYLEMSLECFARNQEQMRESLAEAFGGKRNLDHFEDLVRQNFALYEKAMRVFSPFPMGGLARAPEEQQDELSPSEPIQADAADSQAEIRELREQLAAMQRRVDDLARRK